MKIHNEYELKSELLRLELKHSKLEKEIRKGWIEIKEKGEPVMIAAEMAVRAISGKSASSENIMDLAEILAAYLSDK